MYSNWFHQTENIQAILDNSIGLFSKDCCCIIVTYKTEVLIIEYLPFLSGPFDNSEVVFRLVKEISQYRGKPISVLWRILCQTIFD